MRDSDKLKEALRLIEDIKPNDDLDMIIGSLKNYIEMDGLIIIMEAKNER